MSYQRDRGADSWESALDKQVREAEERSVFDNLPGKGRPLNLNVNPWAGDREMAFKVLKDAGYAPEWIEEDKDIRARFDKARQTLARHWARHRDEWQPAGQSSSPAEAGRNRAGADWQRAVQVFEGEVASLNRHIANLNLKVPGVQFQRMPIDAARELARVQDGGQDVEGAV